MKVEHPWQTVPAEIINFALDKWLESTDSSRRIAFLLFDLGIELTFKAYLSQPIRVTGVKLNYSKRKEAVSGNFHDLINAIAIAAKDRLVGIDISHIEHFHSIRNSLYHGGVGAIEKENVDEYARICVNLLKRLLNVDLFEKFSIPEREDIKHKTKLSLIEEIEKKKDTLSNLNLILVDNAKLIVELNNPDYILPSFKLNFDESRKRIKNYSDDYWKLVNDYLDTLPQTVIKEISEADTDKTLKFSVEIPDALLGYSFNNEEDKILFRNSESYEKFIIEVTENYLSPVNKANNKKIITIMDRTLHINYIENIKYIDSNIIPSNKTIESVTIKYLENLDIRSRQLIDKTKSTISYLREWHEKNKDNF